MATDLENEMHLIAELPTEIAEYIENGGDEDAFEIESDYVATLDHGEHTHYFILCTATLPIEDFDSNLGFGLWVEVFKADFEKYVEAGDDDREYAKFTCTGTLANDWPLFEHTLGDEVQVKVLDAELKPHIIAITSDSEELVKYKEKGSLDENAKGHLRSRIEKLVEE